VVFIWSFAAATPSFRCKLNENDKFYNINTSIVLNQIQPDELYCKKHMKISVKECQRCYIKKESSMGTTEIKACENYIFDRTHYDDTLVEEVCLIRIDI
jgi:hypothetical protein